MAIPEAGTPAPAISLSADYGEPFQLQSLAGKNVVLYFFPKADTPGCTKESCEFRDTSKKFTKANTVIVGVSPDPAGAQAKFKEKFDLPFVLLADVDHKAAQAYGVWSEKIMYGRKYMGVERTTVVIDPMGVIKKVFPKVKVDGHAEEVLAALAENQAAFWGVVAVCFPRLLPTSMIGLFAGLPFDQDGFARFNTRFFLQTKSPPL